MAASPRLRALAAREPSILPGLLAREARLVRDEVEALYRKHRSGRKVATLIGIDFRTLKRWLIRFESAGYPIPDEAKGSYETRDRVRAVRKKPKKAAAAH